MVGLRLFRVGQVVPAEQVNPLGGKRGRDRRHQLMEYAAQRFAEGGYHPTSVADIVDGLNVGKGVFYWYFSSK